MPRSRSAAVDLLRQIFGALGMLLPLLVLRWSEPWVEWSSTSSFNNKAFLGPFLLQRSCRAVGSLGHGGFERYISEEAGMISVYLSAGLGGEGVGRRCSPALDLARSLARRRGSVKNSSEGHWLLACRGGEEEASALLDLLFFNQHRLHRFFLDELNHVDGLLASTIFGRHGGMITTSRSEASLPSCWCSAPRSHQVVRPRWPPGVQRRRIYAGYGCSGVCAPFLDGNVLRMPASGGGGSQGPDCILFPSSRVFFVIWQAYP
ncbi:hypothetical protein QYE76_017098 [Lolium multiflorum]|uniref:Uncharacterized protein n=1 Tax=Lolium multiflorum TaxID=4521 RepID=A0AAD8PI46_LOLMU|nr:hypothetical protein QYE76_017098 [Lolium multiflorum]